MTRSSLLGAAFAVFAILLPGAASAEPDDTWTRAAPHLEMLIGREATALIAASAPSGDGEIRLEIPAELQAALLAPLFGQAPGLSLGADRLELRLAPEGAAISAELVAEEIRIAAAGAEMISPIGALRIADIAARPLDLSALLDRPALDAPLLGRLGFGGVAVPVGRMRGGASEIALEATRAPGESLGLSMIVRDAALQLETEGAERSAATFGPAPVTLRVDMDETPIRISWEMAGPGFVSTLSGPGLPEAGIASSVGNWRIAIATTPEGDGLHRLEAVVAMAETRLSDASWAAVDPEGLAPRDPGGVDLAFELLLSESVSSPVEARLERFRMDSPPLRLAASGAADRRTGRLDLEIAGSDALLDLAERLGWSSAEEVGTVRMLLETLSEADPATPDLRRSRIEVDADGGLRVNGAAFR